MDTYRLKTGSEIMDRLLDGGYESDIITTIYGPGGSGKTNLCLLAAIQTVKSGKKVVFVDTEGNFSVARLEQLAPDYKKILDSIMILKVTDFEQQTDVFGKMEKLISDDVGLVVIDSIASLYRLERDDNPDEATEVNRIMGRQLYRISRLARTKQVPVIVTNQVWQSFDDNSTRMVGGNLLLYASKCIIEIKKLRAGKRTAVLKKHRSLPEEKEVLFEIVQEGIKEFTRQSNV